MGYLGNVEATKATFDEEGYLHTGDQATIDANGMVQITDRIKELIKVKGIGVAPAELEDLLLGHPAVEDVAVLGIADDYTYIVKQGDIELDEETLEFISEIPKSASGKILRRILRDKSKGTCTLGENRVVVDQKIKAKL
ncbi:hypothetical protein HYALB_00012472 [Hymenoscyphus albidus]|uniref:Uncharacterized protein n=1 Tax=Hymenoscyphus albidus TaxID=595503 RepID=A0A9N9Q8R2_9HELO|nr:hypothetical protein HYALB_00012472 [Hymenoscyphus albidus]